MSNDSHVVITRGTWDAYMIPCLLCLAVAGVVGYLINGQLWQLCMPLAASPLWIALRLATPKDGMHVRSIQGTPGVIPLLIWLAVMLICGGILIAVDIAIVGHEFRDPMHSYHWFFAIAWFAAVLIGVRVIARKLLKHPNLVLMAIFPMVIAILGCGKDDDATLNRLATLDCTVSLVGDSENKATHLFDICISKSRDPNEAMRLIATLIHAEVSCLDLSGVSLSPSILKDLSKCKCVELVIKNSKFGDDDCAFIPSGIGALDVSDTLVTDAGMKSLGPIRKRNKGRGFYYLNVANTRITDEGIAAVGEIRGTLDVSGCQGISDAMWAIVLGGDCYFREMKIIADRTRVTGEGLGGTGVCVLMLEKLSCRNTPFSNEGLYNLRGSGTLATLELDNTQITDEGFETFCQCKNGIMRLSLNGTSVGDESISQFGAFTNLQFVSLRDTKVTPTGIQQLQSRHPSCMIGF